MGLPVRIEVCGSDGGLESTELGGIGTGVAGNALSLARGLPFAARVPPARVLRGGCYPD